MTCVDCVYIQLAHKFMMTRPNSENTNEKIRSVQLTMCGLQEYVRDDGGGKGGFCTSPGTEKLVSDWIGNFSSWIHHLQTDVGRLVIPK
jgi:hypothetical protein